MLNAVYLQQQQRTTMRMTRMVRAPAATPTMMVRFWELMGSVLGSVKDKVTLLSAMPPELRATQEY